MDITEFKEEIARIHRGCQLACNKKRECFSECDKCCAEEVYEYLKSKAIQSKYGIILVIDN